MSKKGKISNNYSVEPLEPRFMLSATAEDAAVDWINQQLITEITTSINLSESESVKHNGSNLSINDLISGSFALTSSDVQLTKQGNTDYYDVLLSDDINFESISLNNLSVDVGGHTISGLNGLVNTSISFDGLQLEIIEDDGNFSVSSKQYTDISLNSQISIDEAANAGLNDGYLGLVEQTDSLETSADIEIDVAANQSNSSIDLSFDLEFDTDTNSIVTFNPDMKVTSVTTAFSYDGLTFRDSVDQSIRRIEEAFDFFKDGTSEFINGVKVGNTVVEWNSFAEIIRHYAAAAYVAKQVATSNSTGIDEVFDEILDKTSWNTFDDNSLTISSNQLVLKKTFNGNLNFDLLNVSAIPVDMEIILNLSDSGVTVDKISASISETGISFDTNFGLFDGHVENASVNFDLDVVFRDGEY
uniref:LEPR-XLL domain-containing protein n=1 Tax=uncultured Fibrobacter sp. TaxID=261512 RepID=UPI0025EB0CD1